MELAKRRVSFSFPNYVSYEFGTETNEAAIRCCKKVPNFAHPDAKDPLTEFIVFSNIFHGRIIGVPSFTSKEN